MQVTLTGNLPSLFCKKVVLLISVILLMTVFAHAQANYQKRSGKKYYFGITLGYPTTYYSMIKNERFTTLPPPMLPDTSAYSINSLPRGGFGINIVTNLKLGEYVDMRALPGFLFASREVQYTIPSNPDHMEVPDDFKPISTGQDFSAVYFSVPVQVRVKSAPYKDFRAYLLGGMNYLTDIANKSRSEDRDDYLVFSTNDFQLEAGFGFQFFFEYFILSPEFKVGFGMSNALQNSNGFVSTYIDQMNSRRFTFSLHFEG